MSNSSIQTDRNTDTEESLPNGSGTVAQQTQSRKADHIRICLEEDVNFTHTTSGLERYRFRHCGLPELDPSAIDLRTNFLGYPLQAPLLISSMTGGTAQAHLINDRLAIVAEQYGLAMGVGSQRVALENPHLMETFQVRRVAPHIVLFANLGAIQLNYAYGLAECERLVEDLEANALILHLNPLQEWIQPDGNTNFKGVLQKIEYLCTHLSVPIIVKEVGNGISGVLAQQLINVGVKAIDVAGAGGTSWAKVESMRAHTPLQRRLGQTFADWGIPTADCLLQIRQQDAHIPLIASGGLKHGLDAAKSIALGANMAGFARPLLQAADHSVEAVQAEVESILAELSTVLFCTGVPRVKDLAIAGVLETIALRTPAPHQV
ncbi:MAG: type 2 isopentenyl-diphosphate Delta-isomerase [Prochlorotrichaceae cyanobacterium]|jgi:isopentenyl-diphosphate delta-isomerase